MTTTSTSSTSSTTPPHSKSSSMKRNATMSITKELGDFISNLLGSRVNLKVMLKIELKGDKLENRILALSTYRLYIITVKGTPKLEHSFNYVDLCMIESRQPNHLALAFHGDSRHYSFQSCDPNQEEVNMIIFHLTTTIKTLFPHTPLESFIRKLEVEPRSRMDAVYEYVQLIEDKVRFRLLDLPCGGFSNQYSCFCDYFGIPFREEVAWDIDTIYASHNNTELSILDFEHLDLKDMVPIIGALAFNGWFTKFKVSNVKIAQSGQSGSEQICEQIILLVRKSVTLEEIYLDNTGIRAEFVNKLFSAMLLNNQTSIHVVDLSNNPIEDKGLKNLTTFVAKSFHMANSINTSTDDLSSSLSLNFSTSSNNAHPHSLSMSTMVNGGATLVNGTPQTAATSSAKLMYKGLLQLNLSRCGITSKGISELSESLYLNKSMFSTLTYLNLSDNSFKDDLTKLYNFLAQPNNLSHLDLSGTDCSIESVFGALLHGCTNNLMHLNLSRNQFSSKKSSHKDLVVPAAIKQFFSTAIFLRTINLSNNRLPPEALKAVLLGLACNESANDIRINLSSNEFKSNGAAVLELALTDIKCVSGLDLSDNGLDMDLIGVVNAISRNKSIKILSIGRNFAGIKAKHLPKVLDAFVQLFQDADCSLESFSLADSKLRSETSIVLNALGSNQSLASIDVSGNLMGLAGAKTLAKALQVNTRLETIYLDRNFIPTAGFVDIAYALERNFSLKYLPVPVQDVQAAMIKMSDRTEAAITKIQEYIRRNNLPQSAIMRNLRQHNLSRANFSIDSNLFNKIESNSFQLQQTLRTKSFMGSHRIPSVDSIDITSEHENTLIADDEEYIRAEGLLRDAHNARHLCSKIQEIYSQTQTVNGFNNFHDNYGRRFSSITISRPIEANIIEFAKELKRTFESQIASISELMIQCIKEEFPQVFAQCHSLKDDLKELYQSLINGTDSNDGSSSNLIPSIEYFHMCLTDSACTTWSLKLEQILHSVASQMCNRALLEISRCLSAEFKLLTGGGLDEKSVDFAIRNGHQSYQYQNLVTNGNGISTRSITPDVLSRTRGFWNESSSSHESAELNLSNSEGQMLDVDGNSEIWLAWLNLATPKLQNAKRQNVYIRKLRPQSVLDGAMVANEDFPDLLLKSGHTDGSHLMADESTLVNRSETNTTNQVKHLTKMRPRMRKTRAPTRVTLIDPKNVEHSNLSTGINETGGNTKLDEGLDSFFPTISLVNSLSVNSIDTKEVAPVLIQKEVSQQAYSVTNKPQPQPRKILRKLGFKVNSEPQQPQHPPPLNELPPKTSQDSQTNATHINLKNEDFIRSSSPTFYSSGKRNEHVTIYSETPDASVGRGGGSPLSGTTEMPHNEFLAEMRAKQEKRSHGSTPLNEQITFAGTIESQNKRTSPEQYGSVEANNNNTNNNNTFSIAKRATIFGEVHKSPSKVSINQLPNSTNGSNQPVEEIQVTSVSSSVTTPSYVPPIKQRPKSMVGMLGAKFELSLLNSGNK